MLLTAPATLAHFDATFAADSDPWNTLVSRDERMKRDAILRALPRSSGRLLELAPGNGSNSVRLRRRALRLLAADGAPSAVGLTRERLGGDPRAEVRLARLPDEVPRGPFHAAVVAELLYYLPQRDVAELAWRLGRELAPGATTVLAHHGVPFPDAATLPATVHAVFRDALGRGPLHPVARTRQWRVERIGPLPR